MTFRCCVCNETKLSHEMLPDKSRKRGFSSTCRKCNAQKAKEWREANPDRHKATLEQNRIRRNRERKAFFIELKSKPCVDCKLKWPHYVMEFDHVPERGPKLAKISSLALRTTRFNEELKKCDLVCSNCHAIRTHQRRQEMNNNTLTQDK